MHPTLTEYTNSILVCVGYYEPSQNNHTVYAVYIYSLTYKFLFLLRNKRVKLSGRHKRISMEKRQSF